MENYIEKEFEIAAIVNRPLAQEKDFLNTEVWKNAQSVIMTGEQMEENFGITDYSFINASPADSADAKIVSNPRCSQGSIAGLYDRNCNTERLSWTAADLLFQYCSDSADYQPVPYRKQHESYDSDQKKRVRDYQSNRDYGRRILQDDFTDRYSVWIVGGCIYLSYL